MNEENNIYYNRDLRQITAYHPKRDQVVDNAYHYHEDLEKMYRVTELIMSPPDRIMFEFSRKVNLSNSMNVRTNWPIKTSFTREIKQIDYAFWISIATQAYEAEVIDRNEYTDVPLALQAKGADSHFFRLILKKLAADLHRP